VAKSGTVPQDIPLGIRITIDIERQVEHIIIITIIEHRVGIIDLVCIIEHQADTLAEHQAEHQADTLAEHQADTN